MSENQVLMPMKKRIISRDNRLIVFLVAFPVIGSYGGQTGFLVAVMTFMLAYWAFMRED